MNLTFRSKEGISTEQITTKNNVCRGRSEEREIIDLLLAKVLPETLKCEGEEINNHCHLGGGSVIRGASGGARA